MSVSGRSHEYSDAKVIKPRTTPPLRLHKRHAKKKVVATLQNMAHRHNNDAGVVYSV